MTTIYAFFFFDGMGQGAGAGELRIWRRSLGTWHRSSSA